MMMAPLTLVFLSRLSSLGHVSGVKSMLAKRVDDRGPNDFGSWLYLFLLTLLIAAVSIGVFRFSSSPTMFLISLPLIWIVIRFQVVGASVACFIVTVVLLRFTADGYGPIAAGQSVRAQTIISQSFLATVGLVTLVLATSLRSQRKAVRRSHGTQRRLAALQRDLQRSNQDLEQFAIVASHDLKEPLRAVTGYCRFLKEDYGDVLEPDANNYVDKAIEGADRMTGMINDLLEYSRVSRATLDFNSIELNDVVAKVLEGLQSQIIQSGTLFEVGRLPQIDGYETQLIQLFQNLLSNAMKFVPPETTPRIEISGTNENGQVIIEVADNGIGIDPKHQARIFQIFQRLHRRSDFSGSGLGLAICDRIMSRHGGKIEVSSELAQGATFRLLFPDPIAALSNRDASTVARTQAQVTRKGK